MNGIFLIDTILQTPVQNVSGSICIDIQRHEVRIMYFVVFIQMISFLNITMLLNNFANLQWNIINNPT